MTTTISNHQDRESRSFKGGNGFPFRIVGLLLLALFGVMVFLSVIRVTRIGAGFVGIEINLAGSQRGGRHHRVPRSSALGRADAVQHASAAGADRGRQAESVPG